jgi:Alpha-(1->3)-arabinofuranosyltransferase
VSHPFMTRSFGQDRKSWLVALVLVAAAVVPTFSFGNSVVYYDNNPDVHIDPVGFLHRLMYAWTPDYFMGIHTGFMQEYLTPYTFLYGLLSLMHVGSFVSQRIVVFLTLLAVVGSTYVSLRYIAPGMHRAGRLTAAILACWNIFVAFNMHGSSIMLLPYAAMPAFVAVYAAYVDRRVKLLVASFIMGILSLLASGVNPPLFAIDAAVVALFAVVAMVSAVDRWQCARRIIVLTIASGSLVILLNVYWLVPFLDYFRGVWLGGVLSESTAMHNADTSFVNTLRGFGQWGISRGDDLGPYYLWASSYAPIGIFWFLTWLTPAFAFAGLIFRSAAGRAQAFFLLLAVIGLPLVVGYYDGPGGHAITTPLYDFLFTKVPGFQMFRAAYKWEGAVVFALAGLVGNFVSALVSSGKVKAPGSWAYRVAAIAPVIAAAAAFLPVLYFGMNPPSVAELPRWLYAVQRALPNTTDERGALFPGQYLEPFLWGTPAYFFETPLYSIPLLYGYLGTTPSIDTDQIIKRAYREARAGSPDAQEVFASLSTHYFLQRDDFRNLDDFAFPGRVVLTSASQAHDIITRVIAAQQVDAFGASRIYLGRSPLPVMRASDIGLISALPSDTIAAMFSGAALAGGVPILDGTRLTPAQIAELVRDGAAVDRRSDALLALAISSNMQAQNAYAIEQSLSVRAISRGMLYLNVIGSHSGEPPLVSVDGGRGSICTNVFLTLWSCGAQSLASGVHAIDVLSPLTGPIRASILSGEAIRNRETALTAATSRAAFGGYDFDAHDAYDLPSSRDRITAPPLTWSSEHEDSVPLALGPLRGTIDETPATTSTKARSLLVLPSAGTASTDPLWLPQRFYAVPDTYRWNRGVPQSWIVLAKSAHFWVPFSGASGVIGKIDVPMSVISARAGVSIILNGQSLAVVRLTGSGRKPSADTGFADVLDNPRTVRVTGRLRHGENDLVVEVRSAGVPMSAFLDAGRASSLQAVAAMPSPPQVSVLDTSATSEPLELPRGLAAVRLALPLARLWGAPALTFRLNPDAATRIFFAERVQRRGSVLYGEAEMSENELAKRISLPDLLPNTDSDGDDRVLDAWVIVQKGSRTNAVPSIATIDYSTSSLLFAQDGSYSLRDVRLTGSGRLSSASPAEALRVSFAPGERATKMTMTFPLSGGELGPLDLLQLRADANGIRARAHIEAHRVGRWDLVGSELRLPAVLAGGSCPRTDSVELTSREVTLEEVQDGGLALWRNDKLLHYSAGCAPSKGVFTVVSDPQGNVTSLSIPTDSKDSDAVLVDGTSQTSVLGSGLLTVSSNRLMNADAMRIVLNFDRSQNMASTRTLTLYAPIRFEPAGSGRVGSAQGRWKAGEVVVPQQERASISGLTFDRISPVSMRVTASRDIPRPFLLTLGESYHPMWSATADGHRLLHVEVNGFANAWLVPRLGKGDAIYCYFDGQTRFLIAAAVSLVSLLAAATLMILSFARARRAT